MTPNHPKTSPSSFASDVLKLVGGTTFAQALAILSAPILTRLYAPEAFGVAALFAAITGIITVVACLRYELAIMLPKRDEEAANLLGLSLLIAAGMSALMVPIIYLAEDPLLQLLNAPELAPYLWLSPAAVFLGGVFLALNYWNSRTKRFGRLSLARINASISTTGAQIGAGMGGYPTGGSLIGASILGSAVSNLVLGGQIWRDDRRVFRNSICFEGMKEGLSRHRKFPLIDSWSGLLNSISSQLPVFLTSVFFSSTIVGYYALGHRVLQLPMTFIGSAIAQVFFQRASVANLEGSITNLVESAFTRLIMIGLFPSIIILLAGKDLFMLIFGDSWAEAGVYAQILSPWIFFVFITSPLSTMFAVTEKQGKFLKMNILLFITRMATLIIGGLIGSPRLALALFSLAGMIIWIYMCSYILKESDVPIFPILKNTAIYLFYVMPSLILIIIAKYVMLLTPISLLIISVVGAIFYYICILRKDYVLRSYLLGILKPFFSK